MPKRDISYRSNRKLEKRLSNFYPHPFIIDGVQCASVESFLQSLKFEDKNEQIEVCKLPGREAKLRGQERNEAWQKVQTLWWQGKTYARHSKAYQALISRAFLACFLQNEQYQNALRHIKGELVHSIGEQNSRKTVLTEKEFCINLEFLRKLAREENQ